MYTDDDRERAIHAFRAIDIQNVPLWILSVPDVVKPENVLRSSQPLIALVITVLESDPQHDT